MQLISNDSCKKKKIYFNDIPNINWSFSYPLTKF